MPTYSYRCQSCGRESEAQQAFTDPALTTCDSCGGALRKLFNSIGVTFNGSGFYRTDSRASSPASGESTPSPASDSSKTSSDKAAPAAATPASSGSSSS